MDQIKSETKTLDVQSNVVLLARQEFSIYEKRIMLNILQTFSNHLKQNLSDIKKGKELSITEDLFNECSYITYRLDSLDKDKNYTRIKTAIKKLQNRDIDYVVQENGEDVEVLNKLIEKTKIYENSETITIRIDREFYTKLLDTTKGYTKLMIKSALTYNSIYTVRIYEILAKWRSQGGVYIDVAELRRLTATEDKFKQIGELKKKVLEVARKELNKSSETDLRFSYKDKKAGRLVVGFDFKIIKTDKNIDDKIAINKELSPRNFISKEFHGLVKELGILPKGKTLEYLKAFEDKYKDFNFIIKLIESFEVKAKIKDKDVPSFVVGCIKTDLKEDE